MAAAPLVANCLMLHSITTMLFNELIQFDEDGLRS